jgi:uncharacterized membrane protein YhfC
MLYFTHLLNGLLVFVFAIGLGIFLTRKFHLGWRLYWIGATTFIISQVFHIPFNQGLTLLFNRGWLPVPPPTWRIPFNAVVLGLSAGFFEEFARYATYRWWAKEARSWKHSLLLGAGHGGAEAILVGVLILYTYIQMVALRGADLSALLPADQIAAAQAEISVYWSAPWYQTLLGAVERAFALPVQVALSVLVLQVFIRHQSRWLWLAIAWHALVDAFSVYAVNLWGAYITEGALSIFSLTSLAFIFLLRQPHLEATEGETSPPSFPSEEIPKIPDLPETPENLEETRYN